MVSQRIAFDVATRARFAATDARRDAHEVANLSRPKVANLSQLGTAQTGSDKGCPIPKGYTPPVPSCTVPSCSTEFYVSFLRQAEQAAKAKNRGAIKPPSLPGLQAHARRKSGSLTAYAKIASCLRAVAVRALGDLTSSGQSVPSVDQLAEALEAFAERRYRDLLYSQAPGEPRASGVFRWCRVDPDELARAATQAAARALKARTWSPAGRDDLRVRAAAGGAKGHRGPSLVTDANLARLRSLPAGLTVAEQADRLGLSIATVKRLRQLSRNKPSGGVPGC